MVGDDTITCVFVKDSMVSYLAIRTTTLSCVILLLDGSALDKDRRPIVTTLERMGTGIKCHGTSLYSPENIHRTHRSMEGVPRSILTA